MALSLAALMLLTAGDDAQARSRKHRASHHVAKTKIERYQPPYASIVLDLNSGQVLEQTSADSPRHPASLTKVMTLYLLFERMEAGKIRPSTELAVSEHAAAQAPSKLALKPGETITVENAIRAIVTKSANDVAVVIAEALGGTEAEFGKMMTHKARELGMTKTTYVNASGLPNDEQITTARDQAILGRAIQERFPKYYAYFSTRSFTFRGHAIRNHNKLLGAVEGVDGIKTGYTNASGFNLVTSVRRGGRHIVAAVFGGRTANWRDARMRDLISKYIRVAALQRSAPKLDAIAQMKSEPPKATEAPKLVQTASATPMPIVAPVTAAPPPQGSTEPIQPTAVRTVKVKAANARSGSEAPPMMPPMHTAMITTVATTKAEPPAIDDKPVIVGAVPAPRKAAKNADNGPNTKRNGDYVIQIGAFDHESEAKHRLSVARDLAKDLLLGADPFTERVDKGNKAMYRARFAGFDKEHAEAACKSLRRGEIPCMMLKN
jgi:D-alanyl-D-alanine carboxypeptidase